MTLTALSRIRDFQQDYAGASGHTDFSAETERQHNSIDAHAQKYWMFIHLRPLGGGNSFMLSWDNGRGAGDIEDLIGKASVSPDKIGMYGRGTRGHLGKFRPALAIYMARSMSENGVKQQQLKIHYNDGAASIMPKIARLQQGGEGNQPQVLDTEIRADGCIEQHRRKLDSDDKQMIIRKMSHMPAEIRQSLKDWFENGTGLLQYMEFDPKHDVLEHFAMQLPTYMEKWKSYYATDFDIECRIVRGEAYNTPPIHANAATKVSLLGKVPADTTEGHDEKRIFTIDQKFYLNKETGALAASKTTFPTWAHMQPLVRIFTTSQTISWQTLTEYNQANPNPFGSDMNQPSDHCITVHLTRLGEDEARDQAFDYGHGGHLTLLRHPYIAHKLITRRGHVILGSAVWPRIKGMTRLRDLGHLRTIFIYGSPNFAKKMLRLCTNKTYLADVLAGHKMTAWLGKILAPMIAGISRDGQREEVKDWTPHLQTIRSTIFSEEKSTTKTPDAEAKLEKFKKKLKQLERSCLGDAERTKALAIWAKKHAPRRRPRVRIAAAKVNASPTCPACGCHCALQDKSSSDEGGSLPEADLDISTSK